MSKITVILMHTTDTQVMCNNITNQSGISAVVCAVCSSGRPYGGGGPPAAADEISSTH